MKYFVVLLFMTFSITLFAKQTDNFSASIQQEQIISQLFDQLVNRQLHRDYNIERSVSSLLKNYPEQIDTVLKVAIEKYPHEYKQIICGALRAEPALTSDVVETMLNSNIANSSQVIKIAITEEPAYAKEIVNSALSHRPDDIVNIVRVAILTEPVIAKNVLDDTMLSYPERLLDIVTIAIQTLPNRVASIVSDAIKLFPKKAESVVSTAVSSAKSTSTREIIATAIKSGISKEQATAAAIAGGATSTEIAKVNH